MSLSFLLFLNPIYGVASGQSLTFSAIAILKLMYILLIEQPYRTTTPPFLSIVILKAITTSVSRHKPMPLTPPNLLNGIDS